MDDMSDDQPERQSTRTHGPNGDFVASPETAERDAEAARLRGRGLGYRAIAAQLGISLGAAHEAVQRALAAVRSEPAEEVQKLELERLDAMWTAAWGVLEREHVVVNAGKIVYEAVEYARDEHGNILLDEEDRPVAARVEPLKDDGPVLAAVDRLLKIQARRAALLGLDAPVKAEMGGKLTYEIRGVPAEDL
jgi:hypothetical protein